jgi:ABC-type phosphate/phosphonate transport system substrate-binding protein
MLLLTAVGLFYTYQRPANTPVILQADNPDVTTYGSLLMAYRTGGMEKLDQLCDKALGLAGPWPADISMRELLEVNGNSN